MRRLLIIGTVVVVGIAIVLVYAVRQETQSLGALRATSVQIAELWRSSFPGAHTLNLPEGFSINVFAAGLGTARSLTIDSDGVLYLSDRGGRVFALPDRDHDGNADTVIEVDRGLRNPHGILWHEGDLLVAEEHQIVAYRNIRADGIFLEKEIIVSGLPSGAAHVTRTIEVGPDGKLYVSIGSSCNACEEPDQRNAAVIRYNLNGSGEEVFALGLRNSVGLAFHDGELWSVENGRDRLGDDLPPEEVNIIESGKHYGWPYCYGQNIHDREFPEKEEFCRNEATAPIFEMQAHSAPLGLVFLEETSADGFPSSLEGKLFIPFHGSWNRTVPTGYKVVMLDPSDRDSKPVNFITGWLTPGGAWGRPVDVLFDRDGNLYVTDDKAGVVYRVSYEG